MNPITEKRYIRNKNEPYHVCTVWLEVAWDLFGVDFEQPGIYRIIGEIINTYANIFLARTEMTGNVEIVEQYKTGFRYATHHASYGALYLYFNQWLPNENQTITVWFTDDDGDPSLIQSIFLLSQKVLKQKFPRHF